MGRPKILRIPIKRMHPSLPDAQMCYDNDVKALESYCDKQAERIEELKTMIDLIMRPLNVYKPGNKISEKNPDRQYPETYMELRDACNDYKKMYVEKCEEIKNLHKEYGCELRDPNGTIWEHAAKTEADKMELIETLKEVVDASENG